MMNILKHRRRASFKLDWQRHPNIEPDLKPWQVTVTLDGNDIWTGWYQTRNNEHAWNGFAHHLRMGMP